MSFSPFSLQTLINAIPLEDSQQASQSSGSGSRLFGGRESSKAGPGSRLTSVTSGMGWGNKESPVTVESVEAWGKLTNIPIDLTLIVSGLTRE